MVNIFPRTEFSSSWLEVFKAFSRNRVRQIVLELVAVLHQAGSDSLTRHSVVRRRTFGWSSCPGVPASSSAKEALNKAKRALSQANRMSEAMPSLPLVMALMAVQSEGRWSWCGTNLNQGVLAVLMAQTAAWIT